MSTIAGFPLFPLEIDKAGKVFKTSQLDAIVDAVSKTGPGKITDLFVVSHGWNNDMADAGRLYKNLFENVAQLLQPPRADPARKFAIVGVFWPSKKFTDAELIPGGAASLGTAASGGAGASLSAAAVKKKLDSLEGVFDRGKPAALAKAKKLVDKLETSTKAQKEFADL